MLVVKNVKLEIEVGLQENVRLRQAPQPFHSRLPDNLTIHASLTSNAMVTALQVGSRLSYRGRRCTLRYVGTISGHGEKIFLGVEWDDEDGKHKGTKDGVSYFTCRSLKIQSVGSSYVNNTQV
jgi:hypothetical protein